ncbi:MAG TPA: glycosyltransferase family 4 protein [Labilithrix sp.]|nr:glycosyltransferase family 4 protein [Labilithrix sp.]
MRIAVVTTSYPTHDGDPSGHFVETEAAELEREGHHVLVVRPEPGGAFGWPGAPTRIRERPSRAFEATAWMARAAIDLRRFAPERIIAHWCIPSAFPIVLGTAGFSAVRTGGGADLEVVSHGGDVRLLCALPARVRTRIVRALLRRATRWRFVSEELLTALASSLAPEDAQLLRATAEVVPGALEIPDVREEVRAKRNEIGARRLYVCAGRLVASKRIDKVIDYVATSPNHGTTRDQRVLVVLGDGPERAHLERLANAWRFDVRFLGKTSRRETLGWIGAADELVHASHVEGLSTVVREAETLGVPVTILS